MSGSLAEIEQQRSGILTQILELGDFRSGSITAINGRRGKPNCHCHRPNQPGHGPNFRLTRKLNGKTVSETFSSAAELHKAQCEVEAFHRFRQLSQELLEVNETICRARPVEDTFSPWKTKRPKQSATKPRAKYATIAPDLHRPAQNGEFGSGSHGDGCSPGHASGRSSSLDQTPAIFRPGCRPTHVALSLRPPSF